MLFLDVVHAYKNLSKEKEALEASVQALSATPPQRPQGTTQTTKPQGLRNDREKETGQDEEQDEADDTSIAEEVRT